METATPPVSTPPEASSTTTTSIPTVDLKAPLKIDQTHQVAEQPKDNYGIKLYLLGFLFCLILVGIVAFVWYFLIQTTNQNPQIITVQQ